MAFLLRCLVEKRNEGVEAFRTKKQSGEQGVTLVFRNLAGKLYTFLNRTEASQLANEILKIMAKIDGEDEE